MHHPTDRITHTTAFVTPVVEHWLERVIAQWVHHEGSIRQPSATALTTELHLAPGTKEDFEKHEDRSTFNRAVCQRSQTSTWQERDVAPW